MPAKRIFTIATEKADLERLQRFCQSLDLPAPRCWRHTHLHLTLRQLLGSDDAYAPPSDYAVTTRRIGLTNPLILFCNVPPETVQQMVRLYKNDGEWPIFAVATRQSLEMSLAVLLEHLLYDRGTEHAVRDRLSKSTNPE